VPERPARTDNSAGRRQFLFDRLSFAGSTIFKAAAPLSGESSNTFIAMVATQASMPAAAARAMQSTARFENLRSILILPRSKTTTGEFGSWTICHVRVLDSRTIRQEFVRQEFVWLPQRKHDLIGKRSRALPGGSGEAGRIRNDP
jgi:hypothetical protein